jgi:hypothetical protein
VTGAFVEIDGTGALVLGDGRRLSLALALAEPSWRLP